MKKTINPTQYTSGCNLFFLFFIVLVTSTSFAQDFKEGFGQDLIVSANVLSLSASINSERMSISYHGLSNNSAILFQPDRNPYMLDSLKSSDADFEEFDADDYMLKFGRKLKQMSRFFIKYFNVDDFATDDPDSKFLLKSKVDTDKNNTNDFEFNLSLNVGYNDENTLRMSAIKIESFWLQTYVSAVYAYEESNLELGVSSAFLNHYLLDGMKLEFQASPSAGSGAVLLTMSI
ncbi:MAG: hypothetical protein K8S18_12875 [Desulfobacula sp.]|nr:hypothetical protein [Desulfobacula sp.]